MKPEHLERVKAFLGWYERIHAAEGAYGHEGDDDAFVEAAWKLYEQSVDFLETLPLDGVDTVLDVGFGYGFHAAYFARRGLSVTGITSHLSEPMRRRADAGGYRAVEMDMHFLDFPDDGFDMVWSSHALEHSFSPLLALREWQRVLRPGGVLAVTVPPHKSMVVTGHFTTGWTVGQLLYLLGVTGFDVGDGSFVKQGYNVRGVVRKPVEPVEATGLSRLDRLRDRLPASLIELAERHRWSPGHLQFEGAIRRLDASGVELTGSPVYAGA